MCTFSNNFAMAHETTSSNACANLKAILDAVVDDREPIIIRRQDGRDAAIIAADELRSLQETAYLLRSPKNAERLLRALNRAQGGKKLKPQSVAKLRSELSLGEE